ncbi:thioredoxin O1, mitochondrial isoform X2 [Medicago truncatula]|uniref:thioredoxin O1, mitochondrial isoform X2 n=1 Tax=Medicago truncatula TaxID=3880 RepID=UPI00196746CA|nr:thioredoxin O1, mitochondrial isoform X2 [Medicago truncatula]
MALRNAIKNSVRPFLTNTNNLPSRISKSSLFAATLASSSYSSHLSFHQSRSLSSASASPGFISVNSEEEFNKILTKVQGRFISPIVGELSKKYPNVTTYKIDIDQEAIQDTLSRLQITSVPTLYFFQNGKKTDELIGADVARLNHLTEKLFKKD